MRKHWALAILALLMAALAIVAFACDDDDDGNGAEPTATTAADGEPTAAGELSVEILAPEDGATVASPVTLEVSASGVEIAGAADVVEGAAHYHAFVDQDPVAEGEAVPSEDDAIIHFADDSVELELEPGEHTVTVVLGDNSHIRHAGVAEAAVTFTVE